MSHLVPMIGNDGKDTCYCPKLEISRPLVLQGCHMGPPVVVVVPRTPTHRAGVTKWMTLTHVHVFHVGIISFVVVTRFGPDSRRFSQSVSQPGHPGAVNVQLARPPGG